MLRISKVEATLAGLAMMLAGSFSAEAYFAETPTIKEIMGKLCKGPKSLTPTIAKELKAENPDWTTLETQSKEFAVLAADLLKNTPAKGTDDSWKKLAGDYSTQATSLEKATAKKNKEAALEAHGKLAASCKACHSQHKGK
ncbi:cytochrome C [Isosphaeraceae bacterium EP7]